MLSFYEFVKFEKLTKLTTVYLMKKYSQPRLTRDRHLSY